METLPNREVTEFNKSRKKARLITEAVQYVFISCPDFSHQDGKYDYRSVNEGIPLSLRLAKQYLQSMDKNVQTIISDHEAHRPEVLTHLGLSFDEMNARILRSMKCIQGDFSNTKLLSELYPYQEVQKLKIDVPNDYQMERAIIFGDENKTKHEREESYREKYAQMYTFLSWCSTNQSCPVLLYSKFTFNLATVIRNKIRVPILFLEATDPH